ncbi:MAG: hypothetical protein ACR2RL_10345, partial [Gammaproteobacteria bacterium]
GVGAAGAAFAGFAGRTELTGAFLLASALAGAALLACCWLRLGGGRAAHTARDGRLAMGKAE